jgi:putative transposase
MGISRASFYHKPTRAESQLVRDLALRAKIEEIQVDLPGYGYRRVREHLLREGARINAKRIRRVMKTYSLFSCVKKLMKTRGESRG